MNDLTVIYYTANKNSDFFMANTQKYLMKAIGDTPIISISFKPIKLGLNISIGEQRRSNYMIYKQVLIGVREAKTKYVAMAEDDMLYSPEHFNIRPADNTTFSYDINKWSIFSWKNPPMLSFRSRKLMNSLIVGRDALVATLEERYSKYPDFDSIPNSIYPHYWGEPGRFEKHLGITPIKSEKSFSKVPSIMFSTSEALGFLTLGERKAHGPILVDRIEPWGSAKDILKLYEKS